LKCLYIEFVGVVVECIQNSMYCIKWGPMKAHVMNLNEFSKSNLFKELNNAEDELTIEVKITPRPND
jgi:hypothetical protein